MVKTKTALIFDSLFISFLTTLLIYIWCNKVKNANLLHFILILINILLFVLILLTFLKYNNKKIFKSNNEHFLNSCINFLIQCDYKSYDEFICKLIGCKKLANFFYKYKNQFLYINIKTNLSSHDYFRAQELYFENKLGDEKLLFIYNTKDASFDEIVKISKLNFSLKPKLILIQLMQEKQCFPINKKDSNSPSLIQKIKSSIKAKSSTITKSHFKEIFFTSLSLLFLSLVVPFSKLYLITGTILLIISLISVFKKDLPEKQNDSNIFDIKK